MSEKPSILYLVHGFRWVQIVFFFDIITRHRPLCDIVFSYGDGIILLYTEYTVDAVHMYNTNTRIVLKLCPVCVSPVTGIQQLALERIQYVYNILYNNISNTVRPGGFQPSRAQSLSESFRARGTINAYGVGRDVSYAPTSRVGRI